MSVSQHSCSFRSLCCCLCLIWNSALLDGIFTEKCYLYVTLPLHFSRGLMIPRRPVCAESHIRCGWERPCPAMPWLRKSWGLRRDSRILGWPDDAAAVIPQGVEGAVRELPWKAAWNLCQASRENPRQMLEQQGQGWWLPWTAAAVAPHQERDQCPGGCRSRSHCATRRYYSNDRRQLPICHAGVNCPN